MTPMGDLREYSFGDWFRLFLKAVPAYLLAMVVIALPIAVILGANWFVIPLGR
jgi:hypothetical protein